MRHFLLLPLVMAVSVLYSQSIIVNPAAAPESALTAEQLTVDVLIDGGECSTIENFELTDNTNSSFPNANRSWGYFERGNSNFPFESGIVLTSGKAKDAEGPSSGNVSYGGYDWDGDDDTDELANQNTNN